MAFLAPKYLKASDETGAAILAHITVPRLAGANTLKVDSLDNWPAFFIATTGTLNANGYVVESGKKEFHGYIDGVDIKIEGFEPGFVDNGNTTNEVVVLKQTTSWADGIAGNMQKLTDDVATFIAQNGDWRTLGAAPSVVSQNGNRSTSLAIPGNLVGSLSKGMRLRIPRTGAATQVQVTNLNGTNQNWIDSTVAGMVFLDDYATGAWVKFSSYPAAGTAAGIISRYNGTSGWLLYLQSDGTIVLSGRNGGAANASNVSSYQSLPLNKWVHLTAQHDMSAFTTTPTTSYIMIDGADVPAFVTRSGTNPISIIQAGNLEVGTTNGTNFANMKVAQAFVSSAKIPQANVRGFMNAGITSSVIATNNIISAYAFDGNGNDLNTTNANNLTAQNGVLATNADSPFNANAFAIIMSDPVYSAPNTLCTVSTPEGYPIPSATLGTGSFSVARAPYGFPAESSKWDVEYVALARTTVSAPAIQWYSAIHKLNVPIGLWKLSWDSFCIVTAASQNYLGGRFALSTSTSSLTNPKLGANAAGGQAVNAETASQTGACDKVSIATPTDYTIVVRPGQVSSTIYVGDSSASSVTRIVAENDLL